ncbi:MAG: phosphoribosyltransferase family protein [Parcubacteria group bacterium]
MSKITRKCISYADFGRLMDQLVERLKQEKFTHIYGPARGAWPIATHLSNYFVETKLIEQLDKSAVASGEVKATKILVVDDVCDSGETLKNVSNKMQKLGYNFLTAVLHTKPRRSIDPDIYLEEVSNDIWLNYPWEKSDAEINKDYMFKK